MRKRNKTTYINRLKCFTELFNFCLGTGRAEGYTLKYKK